MSKFHINKKGMPAPCRATSKPCPLGGSDVHFNSEQEAQAYVDKQNKEQFQLLPSSKGKPKANKEFTQRLTEKLWRSHQKRDGSIDEEMVKHCLKTSKYIEIGDSFVEVSASKPTIYKELWYDDETEAPELTFETFRDYNLNTGLLPKKLELMGRRRSGDYGKLRMIPQYNSERGLELAVLTYDEPDGYEETREVSESELVEINNAIEEVLNDYEKRLKKYYDKYKDKISYRGYYRER